MHSGETGEVGLSLRKTCPLRLKGITTKEEEVEREGRPGVIDECAEGQTDRQTGRADIVVRANNEPAGRL